MRDYRNCKEVKELGREAQQHIGRRVTWFHNQEGMLVINALVPADAGQTIIKAIEAACEEVSEEDVSAETPNVKWRIHHSARKADALTAMAETFLAQGAAAREGGGRHQIVVHVDTETLRDNATAAATTNTATRWLPKPLAASPVIAASSPSPKTRTVTP